MDNSGDLYLYGYPEDDSKYEANMILRDQDHILVDSIYLYGILLIDKDSLRSKGFFYSDELIKIFSDLKITELFDACRFSK